MSTFASKQKTTGTITTATHKEKPNSGFGHNGNTRSALSLFRKTSGARPDHHTGNIFHNRNRLKVSTPGDNCEREADRVAAGIMRMDETGFNNSVDYLNRKQENAAGNNSIETAVPDSVQKVVSSPGQPIDSGSKSFFESRFGYDFSGVRIHTGSEAADSADAVNARAYTVGQSVVFGNGEYAPGTEKGRQLMAHELTHVVQQSRNGKMLQRAIKSITNASSDGWLTVRHNSGGTYPPLPQYLKVDHTSTSGGREHFTIKESGQNASLAGTKASVKAKTTGSYLGPATTYGAGVSISFNKTTQKLTFGSTTVSAITDSSNPIPDGTYDLEIPYEVHSGGSSYTSQATYAKTWFRIGHSGDRFLHTGRVSAGCATVTSVSSWDSLYAYLIKSRKGDKKSVGQITVTS